MSSLTLFGGQPVPICPRQGPFVVGVDPVRTDEDMQQVLLLRRQLEQYVRLCEIPNLPFTGQFGSRRWH